MEQGVLHVMQRRWELPGLQQSERILKRIQTRTEDYLKNLVSFISKPFDTFIVESIKTQISLDVNMINVVFPAGSADVVYKIEF